MYIVRIFCSPFACSESASRVLAGDARSIAGEARSAIIGKASDCGGGQNETELGITHKRLARRRLWLCRSVNAAPGKAATTQCVRSATQPSSECDDKTENFSHCQ